MSTLQSVPCSWQGGCRNVTRNTSGTCHLHEGKTFIVSAGTPPIVGGVPPLATLAQPEVDGSRNFTARPYQVEATTKVLEELQIKDRAQIRAACGMGKTIIAQNVIREHHEAGEGTGVYAFVTTGIQLTQQSRDDFSKDGIIGPHLAFSLHEQSDELAAAREGQGKDSDTYERDIKALMDFLSQEADVPKVVFSTYNSHAKLIEAQRRLAIEDADTGAEFDLTVFDEAHRLGGDYKYDPKSKGTSNGASDSTEDGPIMVAGRVPRIFVNEIDGSLQSEKRLFLSATPKVSDERARFKMTSNKQGLQEIAVAEDSRKKHSTTLTHENEAVFGRSVVSWGLQDAIKEGALVPPRPEIAPVQVQNGVNDTDSVDARGNKVSGPRAKTDKTNHMSVQTYGALSGALTSLSDVEGGHNALVFVSRIQESEDFNANFSAVAINMAEQYDPSVKTQAQALAILDKEEPDDSPRQRAARLVMLAGNARVAHASSKSTPAERASALGMYEDQSCTCGGKKYCGCARVVSNVDLFGQGISVNQIDTVVLGDKAKTTDAALTQAVGRALRRWDAGGKKSGRVVIPSTETQSGDPVDNGLVSQSLYGLSRLFRDSTGAALQQRQMQKDTDYSVRTIGRSDRNLEDEIRARYPVDLNVLRTAAAYDNVETAARSKYLAMQKVLPPGVVPDWSTLDREEQHKNVLDYATQMVTGANASAKRDDQAIFIKNQRPSLAQVNRDKRAAELLIRRVVEYDRDSLEPVERTLAERSGIIGKGGVPGTTRAWSFSKLR